MSKYPERYWSESRGVLLDIEEMNDVYLLNAYRKMVRGQAIGPVLRCLADEILARGLDPTYANGKPPVEGSTP